LKKVDLVSIGRIIRSEGKDGTLKIRLYQKSWREPFFRTIYIESEGELRDYAVESLKIVRNSPFLRLKGINSQKEAEALRGREILARPEDFPALENGLYYDFELLGCLVETMDGRELGPVVELITLGETSLLVVDSGGKKFEIPLVEAICRRIDPASRKIVIDPPEGLLELNEV